MLVSAKPPGVRVRVRRSQESSGWRKKERGKEGRKGGRKEGRREGQIRPPTTFALLGRGESLRGLKYRNDLQFGKSTILGKIQHFLAVSIPTTILNDLD
jgi:hypothetical protein